MRDRKNRGFTLAEMLAVVAILVVLFGVIAVNVAARQRSMTRLEFDAIAKEIFIAAQNHLTAAESQGYLGLDEQLEKGEATALSLFGNPGALPGENDVYYILSGDGTAIWPLILPDYAVDPTVLSGSYLIRYQSHPARVLDVFYSNPSKTSMLTIKGRTFSSNEFGPLMSAHRDVGGADNKSKREKYPNGNGTEVIGWYGDGAPVGSGVQLEVPTFEIHNEEQLYVKVFDPNVGKKSIDGLNTLKYSLKLVVKGKSSGAEKYFSLWSGNLPGSDASGLRGNRNGNEYSILLDDVVDGLHFAQIRPSKIGSTTGDGSFTPGEDLEIFVVAYSSTELANIAKSDSRSTNSLFADPAPASAGTPASTEVKYSDVDGGLAAVANFRHLENLDKKVSGLTKSISRAAQTSDMDWTAAWKDWMGATATWKHITLNDTSGTATTANCFYPVSPDYPLTYNGNPPKQGAGSDDPSAENTDYRGRVIKNVKVDYSGPAGLFGTLISGSAVNDLELVDFDVTASSGDAGALIGTADGVAVTNVLARNSRPDDGSRKINASGAAGGLIGSMTNSGSVTNCAAALIVSGGTDAGGLIGSMSGGNVKNSYAGGHTDQGTYNVRDADGNLVYNVTGATAGGLIGTSSATITNCYSTCSAEGNTAAGGLIGSASGTVDNSYATGLVSDTAASAGALIGTGSVSGGGAGNENYYLWIINQDQTWQKNIVDHSTTPEADVPGGITAADADKDTTTFVSFFNGTGAAQPYDAKLIASYEGKYPMHLVGASGTYAATHYGDWPMPETLVINP